MASSEPAVMVEAWQGLDGHLTAVAKIAVVAREFGPRLGDYPQIVEYAGGDGHLLDDTAIMVADGGLQADSAHFQRPDQGHRSSPLFKVSLRLHSIESARARYALWAADQFDRINSRDPGGWIDEEGACIHSRGRRIRIGRRCQRKPKCQATHHDTKEGSEELWLRLRPYMSQFFDVTS